MNFKGVGDKVRVLHGNGAVAVCADMNEAREVCHAMVEIMRTISGRKAPEGVHAVPAGVIGKHGGLEKKKVLINIDKNPEIIKGLA